MKPTKFNRSSLERKRVFFFEIGLIISLSAVLAAFEWIHYDNKGEKIIKKDNIREVEEDIVVNTKQEKPEPQKKET